MVTMVYGTAWKEEATLELVKSAIKLGFRAIDTANQRKHYHEALVGDALQILYKEEGMKRDQFFLQTKFTSISGQDHRLPYDRHAKLSEQVRQSFQSSLEHLQTDYIDSYLLHGPHLAEGLIEEDWEIWKTFEDLYRSGKCKSIGVSNFSERQLKLLITKSEIQPHVVQNRCFAQKGWDKKVRDLCVSSHISYQGFSLLTANPHIINDPFLVKLAQKYHRTVEQIVFRFCQQIGIVPITGTTDRKHMKEDLDILDFSLSSEEAEVLSTPKSSNLLF